MTSQSEQMKKTLERITLTENLARNAQGKFFQHESLGDPILLMTDQLQLEAAHQDYDSYVAKELIKRSPVKANAYSIESSSVTIEHQRVGRVVVYASAVQYHRIEDFVDE
jgi:hypothetical protein